MGKKRGKDRIPPSIVAPQTNETLRNLAETAVETEPLVLEVTDTYTSNIDDRLALVVELFSQHPKTHTVRVWRNSSCIAYTLNRKHPEHSTASLYAGTSNDLTYFDYTPKEALAWFRKNLIRCMQKTTR